MPEKSRQAHLHFLYASELHKIKFRFPERWQKKIKSAGRASANCAAKIQCVDLFPDTFIFANMRVGERLFPEAPNIMTNYRAKCTERPNYVAMTEVYFT